MCLAIPGRVLDMRGADDLSRTGRVDFAGLVREVSLAAVPEVKVGDYVIVHAGFALNVLDESEARAVFDALEDLAAAAGRIDPAAPKAGAASASADSTESKSG